MSNTTPETPEDRPAQDPAAEPATETTDTGAHVASTGSATDGGASDGAATAEPASETTDTGAHVASTGSATDRAATGGAAADRRASEDDLDDEPGVAGATPVASSAHISGASDTGQTRAYEPVTNQNDQPEQTERPTDRPVTAEQATPTYAPPTEYRSANDYPSPNEYQSTTGQQPIAQPVYVTAPQRPARKGNRGAGILIALLATIVYAIVSALVVLVIFAITKRTTDIAMHDFIQYVGTASYYIPIIFFFLAFILLIAIVNRGGWWAYILGAFFVAVVVYFAYVGGVLVTIQAWKFSQGELARILSQLWANPLTIGSAIVAREVPIWFGLWIAYRGRKVRERNDAAQRDYERALADGPQPIDRTA
jgi:hypothetical protein